MSSRAVALVILALSIAGEFISDLLIRARNLDGVNGIQAGTYDVVFSLMLGFSGAFLVMSLIFGKKD